MDFEFSEDEALFIYGHLKKRADKEIPSLEAVHDNKNANFERKMNGRIFEEILSKYPAFKRL
ncbi:MAG: hypothetical protein DUD32_09955 [Lactobacillus sp.]|nr:MAG: hypothetical protein DUD32_09955 [Lactobacillus sp.]